MLGADTLCLDGPDVQEGKRRSIARVTIALYLDGPSRLWLDMSSGNVFPFRGQSAADTHGANCQAPERAGNHDNIGR